MKYKKRSGTSGLHGQLYETKLLSLLNFRAKHDDDIEEFYLATNVDLIGEMDDICFRAKVKDLEKPIAAFIQTKHRDTNRNMTFNIKNDLAKYFASYLKIKQSFSTSNKDKLFEGTFSGTECLFIMYTNAKYDFENNLIETDYITKLKDLIDTSETGCYKQPPTYEAKDVEFLGKIIVEEQVSTLAEYLAKSFNKEVSMTNELVLCYHYILGKTVFDVSDIQPEGHRIASFRKTFFETTEHFALIFKKTFYKNVLLKRKLDMPQILNLLEKFFNTPSDVEILSELIGTVITYKSDKLEFISTMSEDLRRQLNKVNVLQASVEEAIDQAAKKILEPLSFKVPSAFGNKDLTIRGNEEKVENRLKHLTSKIVNLIRDFAPNTIITIDESLGTGLLQVNGGLAGAVGNVFVPDENSKLMKFADNIESLQGNLAKRLYLELQTQLCHDLQEYKFVVKVKNFTKLSFDSGEHEENLVREFLSKMIFFSNQSHEKEIGEILKREMVHQPYAGIQHFRVKADAIFLKYHDAIQKWWVTPDAADYLTKDSKHFEKSLEDVINQPLISVMDIMHKFKFQKLEYTFSAAAITSLELNGQFKTNVIVTNNCLCTVAKIIQHLNNINHVVLHLEFIEDLLVKDYKTLCTELTQNKETVIFVNVGNRLEKIKNVIKAVQTQLFIVTNEKELDLITSYCPASLSMFRAYDYANNLIHLSKYSQEAFLKNTKVIFQGKEVSLDLFVNDNDRETMELVEGNVFHDMLQNKIIKIGILIGNHNYDDFKHLYIDRRLSRIRKSENDTFIEVKDKLVKTLFDLEDNVVLVTAIPGMGKSTLLSHLSIKTKELDPKVWIIRINLLEYSQIFSKWQENKTAIDLMLSLNFVCRVALGVAENDITVELQTEDNVVSLKHCSGDPSITFGLKMFLHYYNSGTLIFLFDGFDEIFPHYENEALSLLKSVTSYHRRHKIWITSRSYNDIKDILEHEFGQSYDIEHFSDDEQKIYLRNYWKSKISSIGYKLVPRELKRFRLTDMYGTVYSCACDQVNQFLHTQPAIQQLPYYKVCSAFVDFMANVYRGCIDDDSLYLRKSSTFATDFVAPPLHLYLLADYMFTQTILFQNEGTCTISLDTHELYKHFVEVKLKKIRFQEKKKIDLSIPDNIHTYERERADFVAKHKKLGVYATCYAFKDSIFSENDLKEVEEIIEKLRLGREKTGLIHSVAGNIPLFIHKVFAEYFAIEYIYDLMKSDNVGTQELIERLSYKNEVFFKLKKKLSKDSYIF